MSWPQADERDGLKVGPRIGSLVGGAIALKVAILFVLAWNTKFVMDEFIQLGWAKHLGNGLFDTIWPAKAAGTAAFYKLAHLIGWDAVSILLVGRLQTALLACGTLAIIYGCARRLGQDRVRALLIVLVLLSFSNFIERSFRTIAEPLALFFAAAALLVLLRGEPDRRRDLLVAGLLSGLSFLATQKAAYFNFALGFALVADAALSWRYVAAIQRGFWLVLGWTAAFAAYCLFFGGTAPLPVAASLVLGPVDVATSGADAYSGLRRYVLQTLLRNPLLYIFCFAGMALAAAKIAVMDARRRIALIFTLVVTLLVFLHDQPWPYVFIMALPFMALWALEPLNRLKSARPVFLVAGTALLGIGVAGSFVRNINYLKLDNRAQLVLIDRAETLVQPGETYFDGIAMLPNRREPTTLWLDRRMVLETWRQGRASEAFRVFSQTPPKVILWSYRMDDVQPVIGSLIKDSYVPIAPNLRVAGRRLIKGQATAFRAPVAGRYALYDAAGKSLKGEVVVNGKSFQSPVQLDRGLVSVTLNAAAPEALLLPVQSYAGRIAPGPDDPSLFAGVYD